MLLVPPEVRSLNVVDTKAQRTAWQRSMKFRPRGSPAGTWGHTPWWHCAFHDPYERVNVWSHGLPAVVLFAVGMAALSGLMPDSAPVGVFGLLSSTCHALSALAHIYPDHHGLEKLDHLGILALLFGTPYSAILDRMNRADIHIDLTIFKCLIPFLLASAFFPPKPRTLSFAIGVSTLSFAYWRHLISISLLAQLGFYLIGALCFLRNGGHDRWEGWSDHHILHYVVTAACCVQIMHLIQVV